MSVRIWLWSALVMIPQCCNESALLAFEDVQSNAEQADKLAFTLSEYTAISNPTNEQRGDIEQVTKKLRALGPTGLRATIRAWETKSQEGAHEIHLRRLDRQLDLIAGQKHARSSRLYWYKSLEAAQAKSLKSKRPILSLRLLGHLDKDMSCANSRFFRRFLYTNPQISDLLSQQFILHWQPVREVPIATINFGDGRKLKQPISGNSTHLAVTDQGRVIDALPGLVTPSEFMRWAQSLLVLHKRYLALPMTDFQQHLQSWHQSRARLRRQQSDLTIGVEQRVSDLNPLDPRWKTAAKEMKGRTPNTTLGRAKQDTRTAAAAMITAPLKMAAELPLFRMVESLEPRTTQDSFFNLYGLQPKLDDWYAHDVTTGDYDKLTNRIYKELFLMPLTDPWLGLSNQDRSIALDQKE